MVKNTRNMKPETRNYTVAILTISDKGSKGERTDQSGPALQKVMDDWGAQVLKLEILPDERELISEKLIRYADVDKVNLVLTTGGTGLSPRDWTPEATKKIIDREVPGITELMRQESYKITPKAMLSRAVAGTRGSTLIINLPGSPKGAVENLQVALPILDHALGILLGEKSECASPAKG